MGWDSHQECCRSITVVSPAMVPVAVTRSWAAARHCLERDGSDLEQGTTLWDTLMGAEQGLQSVLITEKLSQSRWKSAFITTMCESAQGPKIPSQNERWASLPQPPAPQAELQMLFLFPATLAGLGPKECALFQTSHASVNEKLKPQKLLLLCKLGSKTQSLGSVPGSRTNGQAFSGSWGVEIWFCGKNNSQARWIQAW